MNFEWNQIAAFLESNTVMLVLSAILSLVGCFFGYKLMRVGMTLAGFVAGAVFGGWLALHFTGIALFALIAALVLGVLLAVLANRIYLAGVFLFCGWMSYSVLAAVFGTGGGLFALHLVIAAVIGVLAVNFVRPVVIVSTPLGGGFEGVATLFVLCDVQNMPVQLTIGALVALAGVMLQLSTTKKGEHRRR